MPNNNKYQDGITIGKMLDGGFTRDDFTKLTGIATADLFAMQKPTGYMLDKITKDELEHETGKFAIFSFEDSCRLELEAAISDSRTTPIVVRMDSLTKYDEDNVAGASGILFVNGSVKARAVCVGEFAPTLTMRPMANELECILKDMESRSKMYDDCEGNVFYNSITGKEKTGRRHGCSKHYEGDAEGKWVKTAKERAAKKKKKESKRKNRKR